MKPVQKTYLSFPVLFVFILFFSGSCKFKSNVEVAASLLAPPTTVSKAGGKSLDSKPVTPLTKKTVSASTIMSRPQIPILCYHQLRDWKPTDSKRAKDYIVPVAAFKEQMKLLADSGYTTILPDQLYNYLVDGEPLPEKPVMLTFDDTDLDQYTLAAPEMNKYGFRGVFFIMTVSLGKPRYMSKDQVKELSDAGNVIGSHTWDHKNVKKFTGEDWSTQIEKPSKQLEQITSKPVNYFAFPFGLWKPEVIEPLKRHGFVAAFQLTDKRDERDPLYTIRRMIVPGEWSAQTMLKVMNRTFK